MLCFVILVIRYNEKLYAPKDFSEYDIVEFRKFIAPYQIKTDDPSEEEFETKHIRTAINSIFGSFNNLEKFVRNTFTANKEIENTLNKVRRI